MAKQQRKFIPEEFKELWLSFYRAALTGLCANPERIAPGVTEAAEIADAALEPFQQRFINPES